MPTIRGWITDFYALPGTHDWLKIWLIPAAFALFVLVSFAVVFRNETLRGELA